MDAYRAVGIPFQAFIKYAPEGPRVAFRGSLSVFDANFLAKKLSGGGDSSWRAPAGTRSVEVGPTEIRVGDFVLLDGRYYEVLNLRSAHCHSRTLELRGLSRPWVMTSPRKVYRPAREESSS
ncbi:hypothetical protein [Streptomyces sp. NPDC014685]|uniref:hypothetical protein n=1 Tax=Streptomyces sp. NPDC014685 TaxID=3364881 RepID=UPI0036F5C6C0